MQSSPVVAVFGVTFLVQVDQSATSPRNRKTTLEKGGRNEWREGAATKHVLQHVGRRRKFHLDQVLCCRQHGPECWPSQHEKGANPAPCQHHHCDQQLQTGTERTEKAQLWRCPLQHDAENSAPCGVGETPASDLTILKVVRKSEYAAARAARRANCSNDSWRSRLRDLSFNKGERAHVPITQHPVQVSLVPTKPTQVKSEIQARWVRNT